MHANRFAADKRAATLGLIIVVAGFVAAAQAQGPPFGPMCGSAPAVDCASDLTGPFTLGEGPFFQNTPGIFEDIPNSTLDIDQNCNGLLNDAADITVATPAEILNVRASCPSCNIQWRLTPSQEFAYALVSNQGSLPGCGSSPISLYVYAIDPGPTLTPFAGNGVCVPNDAGPQLAFGPVFHDYPGFPVRTGIAAGRADSFGQSVYWIDLVNRQLGSDSFTYAGPIDDVRFSPVGNAALLVSNSGGTDTQWVLADLCLDPLGGSVASGTPTGNVTASITGGAGALFAAVDTGAAQPTDIALPDCLCGACCDNSGCVDGVFAADCVEFIPGATCTENPCAGGVTDVTLTIDILGTGSGRVRTPDGTLFCTSDCAQIFPIGTILELQAIPFSGSAFTGWSGDASGTTSPIIVQLTGDTTIGATFDVPIVDGAIQSITLNPAAPIAGESVVYTYQLAELDGQFDMAFALLEVTPPAGMTFDPALSDPGCSVQFDGTIRCQPIDIPAGGSTAVAIGFQIDPLTRSAAIAATLTTSEQDTNPANNTASRTDTVAGVADLSATLSAAPNPVAPGGTLAYTVNLTNAGPSSALNVTLNEALPAGVTLLAADGSPVGGSICANPEIAPSVGATLSFLVAVDPGLADGTQLAASISVSSDETDPNPSGNTATATVTVDATAPVGAIVRRLVIADTLTPMPNGVTISGVSAPSVDNGNVAFIGTLNAGLQTQPSVYRYVDGVLQTVADFNDTPPFSTGPLVSAFDLTISGIEVAFEGLSDWPFVPFWAGLYTSSNCGLEPIIQLGDPMPGLEGEFTGGGGLKYVSGRAVFWDNGEVFIHENGVVTPIALRNAPMPDGDGDTFSGYGFTGWDFDGEYLAFRGVGGDEIQLPGGGTAPARIGIYVWRYSTNTLTKIIDNTDPTPAGGDYNDLGPNVAVDDGLVVFLNGSAGANPDEIYLHEMSTNTTQLILDTNTPIPAGLPRTFRGYSLEFDIDDGRILIPATSFTGGNGYYIWEAGNLTRVMAQIGSISSTALSGETFAYSIGGFFGAPEALLVRWGDPGDFDLNGAINQADAAIFLSQYTGPNSFPLSATGDYWTALTTFDFDLEDDLDLTDLAELQRLMGN